MKHSLADFKQITSLAYGILILVAGLDGLGHHIWDFTLAELPNTAKLLQVTRKLGSHKLCPVTF